MQEVHVNVVEKEPMWRPSDLFDSQLNQREAIPKLFEEYRALTFDTKSYQTAMAAQNELLDL